MKIGLGLYRHILTRDHSDFARQVGCTQVAVHLVDYFNQGPSNRRYYQPTSSKYEPWGLAGDAGWTPGCSPWALLGTASSSITFA
jgi:mannonate dehydratase